LTVVTRNVRDFENSGVRTFNPFHKRPDYTTTKLEYRARSRKPAAYGNPRDHRQPGPTPESWRRLLVCRWIGFRSV
jgi:hypothetical protein